MIFFAAKVYNYLYTRAKENVKSSGKTEKWTENIQNSLPERLRKAVE
jgi:hypothetical protein